MWFGSLLKFQIQINPPDCTLIRSFLWHNVQQKRPVWILLSTTDEVPQNYLNWNPAYGKYKRETERQVHAPSHFKNDLLLAVKKASWDTFHKESNLLFQLITMSLTHTGSFQVRYLLNFIREIAVYNTDS